ncbi:MAG: sigma 54-interacting transcriptional regulator [Caldimicrobium sp.]|nr:sigma 54-interacting transcriptional regulator [Caldimicrobium sp.]MDW8182987.1 sigma 54-interacting transcriptional regulator [Caldimicrobium sp.]
MIFTSKIGDILAQGGDFKASLQEILKVLYSYWDVTHSFIALYDPSSNALKIVASFGLRETDIKGWRLQSGEGIVGRVFKNAVPVLLKDLEEKTYLNKMGLRERLERGTSFLAVPIKAKDQVLGVLGVFKRFQNYESADRGLEFLQILATLLSLGYQMDKKLLHERASWEEEKKILTQSLQENFEMVGLIGKSQIIKNLLQMIKKVAQTKANVLITGESGTGKSFVAKVIHFLSPRKSKSFIAVNCSAIPETLLEAELFGFEKGAFTGAQNGKRGRFELANGGTIFLDEIGDLPLSLQPKLLRVIQEKEFEKLGKEASIKVDVRIISATNRNLEELMRRGLFREDLYYRLNVISLHIPPLRERQEDIPLLTEYFLQRFNNKYEKNITLEPSVLEAFMRYHWPGNVRELENLLERLVILAEDKIRLGDLPKYICEPKRADKEDSLKDFLNIRERDEIIRVLEKTGYVKSRAAKLLGLTLRQLDYRIKKYSISIPQF